MVSFRPAKLAFQLFEPVDGEDETLSPVLFLHGVTGSKEHWSDIPQIIADKTKRKAYALDARNHGDSEYTDVFNFDINADDLFYFMDSIDAPKAVLVGHSMGAITSIKAALKEPERVEMIFAEDMFVRKVPKEILDSVIGYVELYLEGVASIPSGLNDSEAFKCAMDYVYSKVPSDTPYLGSNEKIYKLNVVYNRNPDGSYEPKYNKDVVIEAMKNYDTVMCDPSGEYNGPAYFIYGSLSPFMVGKEEENIKEHFPEAELIEIGATHNVHLEFPDEFVDAIVHRLG